MADILFKCATCGQNLLIEEAGVGLTYDCTSCGGQMVVPAPIGEVECAGCRQSVKVAAGMSGESVRCPNCGQALTGPAEGHPRLKLKGEGPPPLPAAPSDCPSCHAPVTADTVICVQCGLNLKTGKKIVTAAVGAVRAASREEKESRQKLIKNVVLVAIAAGIFAFAIPRIWQLVFSSAPQYSRPATVVKINPPEESPAPGQPPHAMPGMPGGPMLPPGMPVAPPGAPGVTGQAAVAAAPAALPAPPPLPGKMPAQMPPGMIPPMMRPVSPTTSVPPSVATKVVEPPKPPAAPVKPPPLLTAEDLQKLGPLKTLTVAGITYEDVRWTQISPREVFFLHHGGAASVPIVKLLPALKEQYHYAPSKHE